MKPTENLKCCHKRGSDSERNLNWWTLLQLIIQLHCSILKYWYASNKNLDENSLVGEFVDWTDKLFPFAIRYINFNGRYTISII